MSICHVFQIAQMVPSRSKHHIYDLEHGQKLCDILKSSKFSVFFFFFFFFKNEITLEQKAE